MIPPRNRPDRAPRRPRGPLFAVLAAALVSATVFAPGVARAQDWRSDEEDPAGEFLFGDTRTALGYSLYRSSFVELGYTFGYMPWLSVDGRERVMVSGLQYDENKGPLINFVTLVLALSGVSDWEYAGSTEYYDVYVYDPVRAERERAAIRETFSQLPLSMGIRGYAGALGSEADGFVLEASFRDAVGEGMPAVVWGIGAHIGWFGSSFNWGGTPFNSVWGGGNFDLRVTLFEYMGLWLRVGLWVGGPQGVAVPIELGPEVLIGNRFYVRGLASVEPVRYQAIPDGIGMRLEAGLRL